MDNFTLISLELNATSYGSNVGGEAAVEAVYGLEHDKGSGSIILSTASSTILQDAEYMSDDKELHVYLRATCLIFLFVIFTVGVIGNIMVTLVIGCSRDMRTSTNIFLVNLSIADMLVLLVCTPTALIELGIHPDRWILGFYLCKFVPLLETIVANASVLTILAISFERYYAICRPLRANYICTKSRAVCISVAAWILASIIASPMAFMIVYKEGINEKGEWTARCDVIAGQFWPDTYTISTIILCFLLPLFILLIIYGMIANRLTMEEGGPSCNAKNENHKARKQVVVMLGSVCVIFFLCLLPFRLLVLYVILSDHEALKNHADALSTFLYFSRIMVYLNSSLNPILYNVMSSKFRNGFLRLCNRHRKPSPFTRNGTFLTNTTTTNSNNMSINLGHQSSLLISNGIGKGGSSSLHNSPDLNGSSSSSMLRKNGMGRVDGKTLKNYLLSQSHGNNGFLISQRAAPGGGVLYNGIGTLGGNSTVGSGGGGHPFYPFQEVACSSSFRNGGTTTIAGLPKPFDSFSSASNGQNIKSGNGNNNYTPFTGNNGTIKSDTVFSAYIPGRRSETVL